MDSVGQVMFCRDLHKLIDDIWRGKIVGTIVHFEEDQFDVPDFARQVTRVGQDVSGNDVRSGAEAKRIHHAPARKASNTTVSTTSTIMPNTSPVTPPIRD